MSASDGQAGGYRDLQVWRQALDWAEAVYRATNSWPSDELFGLTSQVRRAAVSVASNLAEGASRRTPGEFLQFIGIARGSLAEAETELLLSARLSYTSEEALRTLLSQADVISRMLAGPKKSISSGP